MKSQQRTLQSFARYAAARDESHVRTDSAVAWAACGASPARRSARLHEVARLARFARCQDPAHEVPAADVFGCHRQRPVPYIFTLADIDRLILQARHLGPARSLWPRTVCTLLALLSCTGLRISEALALRLGDLTADGLIIRETKFKKSRLVPLHETASRGVNRYLVHRRKVGGATEHLFIGQRGGSLVYDTVRRLFSRLVRAVGSYPKPGQPKPRLHSLRHSFAVRALQASPDDRDRVARHTLALSTYLGHGKFADTCWYFEATPQLLADIARRGEQFMMQGAP